MGCNNSTPCKLLKLTNMLDLNNDELLSLHRYIFETKFSEDAQEIAFTLHVSQIANKVLDEIIANAEKTFPDKAIEWKSWRILTKNRQEWKFIKNKIAHDKYWKEFDTNQKIKHLEILASPLTVSKEIIKELIP